MKRTIATLAAGLAVALLASCASAPPPAPVQQQLVFPKPPDDPRFVYERTIYGSADVLPADKKNDLRRMVTGEMQVTETLAKPYAVAVSKGKVYVSDSVQRYIRVFDFPGGRDYRIGEEQPGKIQKPLGIDVDRAGNLYVADATAKEIKVFAPDGRYLKAIGTGQFDRLASVTVDRAGERVYVTDIAGVASTNHRVRIFDARSGKHLFDIGKRGSGDGEFNLPRDVAVGKDGRIYVVDGGNFRIQVFNREGHYMRSFGSVGKQFGQFARPKEIATDDIGNVYVVDSAFGNFQIFDAEGDLLLFIGERAERDGPAKYMLPSGIYVDEDGRIYMVDQWYRKVDVFRPAALQASQGFLAQTPKVSEAAKAK